MHQPVHPTRISENGRYFIDGSGTPVFWLGTTQWQLFHGHSPEEARTILHASKERGFTFVQAMIAGVGSGAEPSALGETPWLEGSSLTPNPAYFEHVDAVIDAAAEMGLVISILAYHQRWRDLLNGANAREWARWLAARYRRAQNVIWSLCPEAKPEYLPILRELAAGLREGDDGEPLITVLPDPSPYSSSFIHEEPWLAFNSIQTWKQVELIHPMVFHDYALAPVKPVVMAEGAYEAGSEYGFEVTPLWVRRQAYYSYLCGAHHAYGHNDSWRMLPTWRQALDARGARQMGILKQVFLDRREWWRLVPDQSLVVEGGCTSGTLLNLAARHEEGEWIIVYLASPGTVGLDLSALRPGRSDSFWIEPRTGRAYAARGVATRGARRFTTPHGFEDALLILEPAA